MQSMRRLITLSTILFLLSALPAFAALPLVDVPLECTVTDTDAAAHTYSGQYLGICALEAARAQGIVSAYTLQNFSFGLFLQSLNGIVPGETEFWALYHNGALASVGLTDLAVVQGDVLKFQLTDWSSNTDIGSPVEFSIGSLLAATSAPSPSPSGGGGGEFLKDRTFNVESAFDFLVARQHADGSFGSSMLTDWAAIAFGTAVDEVCNDTCPAARDTLRAYVASATVSTSSATELERHIMALEALGIDPYSVTGSPVDALIAKFDGTQIGDASLVNDDIFALFPLIHAGYATTDNMMERIVTFILFKQKTNGSWEGSVDLTAAAIQTLIPFSDDEKPGAAIKKAEEFLRRNQNESGIFGSNSFSLSWVLQAISSLGQTPEDWKKSGLTPLEHLGVFQQDDGGIEPMSASTETRIWATSYAIPAAFGKSWNDVLHDFTRPVPIEPQTPIATTSSPPEPAPLPEQHSTVTRTVAAAPKPTSVSTNEIAQSTTTEATTTALSVQVAAAVETTNENGIWLWLAGLLLIAGTTFYFLRRA